MPNYQYPIELDWTHEEMTKVINFLNAVEAAYETGVDREELLAKYRLFKEVIPSKGEEKRYGNQFEKESGYSLYRVVKEAKESDKRIIQMKIERRR